MEELMFFKNSSAQIFGLSLEMDESKKLWRKNKNKYASYFLARGKGQKS